jgi:protein pelota
VRAPAIRRVQNVSATGSTESHRVRTTLTIEVTRVEWAPASSAGEAGSAADPTSTNSAQVSTAGLSISGPVVDENQHVRLGAFHTLDIEVNRNVRIEKADGWDSVAQDRVKESCIPGRGAEVAAVVCSEGTPS